MIYKSDCLHVISYRWDIIAERLGFMLVFGDLVWIPFTFSIQVCYHGLDLSYLKEFSVYSNINKCNFIECFNDITTICKCFNDLTTLCILKMSLSAQNFKIKVILFFLNFYMINLLAFVIGLVAFG